MDPRSEILKNRSKPFFGGCGAGFSRVSTGVVAEGDMRDLSRTGLGRRRGPEGPEHVQEHRYPDRVG
ncbi:hypothetical protein JCM4914_30760 [Streptomyces platensis subsp. malvinus]